MIRDLLYRVSPWAEAERSGEALDLRGWNSEHPVFADLIGEVRPRLIAEVGTWKGASALHMWRECGRRGLEVEIVCVDTWLGSVEHWLREGSEYDLGLRLGHPTIYGNFIDNVMAAGAQDAITPFPATSRVAAAVLAAKGVRFDLIYLDASHEYEDVRADIAAWLPLVRPGGVLFGDDADWSGVARAIDEVPALYKRPVEVCGRIKWVVRV